MTAQTLPLHSPLIAYYGDDLTGSTAVMEATAFSGLETILFLDIPDQKRLADFPDARVIGIAGDARARSPEWMDEQLPLIYRSLQQTNAPIIHYKICSTFDSAPHIGSIGRAADIAGKIFSGPFSMLTGDPGMGRYQCFGHLFAVMQNTGYRIDRHPVMAHHPITPMDESDLLLHLQKQTTLKSGLVDFVSLKNNTAGQIIKAHIENDTRLLSFDMIDHDTLTKVGQFIWNMMQGQKFCLGSQGLERALVSYWQTQKWIEDAPAVHPARPCAQILAVSGSVSPMTAMQIAHARANGFAVFPLQLDSIADPRLWQNSIEDLYAKILKVFSKGQDVLICSAEGPHDPAVVQFKHILASQTDHAHVLNNRIGDALGQLADRLLKARPAQRLVISGGDTSGRVARQLNIDALTAIAPMAAGAPLCKAHCMTEQHHGLEVLLKGGQVGDVDIFMKAKSG